MQYLVAILLTVLMFGCQEDEHAPYAPRLHSGTGDKPMREVLERGLADDEVLRCDIRVRGCQEMIFDTTVAVRGGATRRPPVTVISRDALAAQLNGAADKEVPSEKLRTLVALGLADPSLLATDVTNKTADSLLAAYLFDADRVIVVDHGKPLDSPEAALTLSHEFVHALQDEEHDLAELRSAATTTDQREGLLGVIEGEAEVYSALAITGEVKTDSEYWKRLRRNVVNGVLESEASFFAADVNFPYTLGTEFVSKTYAAEGSDGIMRRYDAIPGGSREIVAGFGAEAPASGWGEPVEGTETAAVEDGYEPVFEDAFGSWVLHVFLERTLDAEGRVSRLPTESEAIGLRGDRVVTWQRDDDLVVAWQLRFDETIDPEEVVAEIADAGRPGLFARQEAGDVVVFASESPGALEAFAASFELPPR